ncbi:MAG: hypothetical protein IIB41_03660, partial [Candidatus Marinimicrobia bacterium]|nr:hypothetical protein [Candidatus Neomarinimicrobiota bacterium]
MVFCKVVASIIIGLFINVFVDAQTAPWHYQTLIPENLVDKFIGEISGEIAMSHVYEMAAYNKGRTIEEYQTTFREALYVYDKAIDYGFDTVEIEYFESDSIWDGEVGELWEISPNLTEIADYDDQKAVLAVGSKSAEVTAELIYVGNGTNDTDYESIDVRGKIVLGYGGTNSLHTKAVLERDAAGVISFASIHPVLDPDQIPWFGISKDSVKSTFAFNLGYRRGDELRRRLEKGEKITLRATVKSSI